MTETTGQAAAGAGYFAFISYSHRDSAQARRIHRALETYRLPVKLRGTDTALGPVPDKLFPIFRDREELSAGNDLSRQVQDALIASRALIVLCSPSAKASVWVGKEIETFRSLYPDRPILAALIEGGPDEAFPLALTQDNTSEPVAADFRKSGDGPRLGMLKLVAGLTGVGLDGLVQRDSQRQLRRVTAITLGSLAAVLVMAALMVMALRAQAEAERQRMEAEGLVEYMLTDLRDRLKGVGRLDVMTAVNERAMTYYGQQGSLEGLPGESLDRRARVLHAMGEDDEKRGELAKALAKFSEAHRTTSAVLAQKPNDPEAIFAQAQSENWVGYAQQKLGQNDRAMASFLNYQRLAEQLATIPKFQDQGTMELGWAHNAIGTLYLKNLARADKAQEHFEQYRSLFARLAQRKPKDTKILYSLSDAQAWIASAHMAQNRLAEAKLSRIEQRNGLQRLLALDPSNQVYKLGYLVATRDLFRVCWRQKDYQSAGSYIRDAQMFIERNSEYDRKDQKWLLQVAYVALDAGYLAHSTGNIDEARKMLIRGQSVANQVIAARGPADHDAVRLQTTITELQRRISSTNRGEVRNVSSNRAISAGHSGRHNPAWLFGLGKTWVRPAMA